jgi:hypothetical protein
MFGGSGQIGRQVNDLVEQWIPQKVHDHEHGFQSELQEYLDEQLNNQGGGGFGLDMGGGNHVVSTERGISRGDVVVDDVVGIELKRNFSNSQKKKLRGQLEDYADNYDFVIAVACGIEDMDGWRELENKFSASQRGIMDMTEFNFVVKRREDMGKDPKDSGGLFGGLL